MTIPTQAAVDAWQATTRRQLDTVRATLLDLIDCGTPTPAPVRRPPSARDREATDRADGRFEPTPRSTSRRTGRSDPTGRAVERWETDVQQATTALYGCVSAATDLAGALGLTPVDEAAQTLSTPEAPATRTTSNGTVVVDVGPGDCRRAILNAVTYLGAVHDALADRMRGCTDPEVGDHLAGQATMLQGDVRRVAVRFDAVGRPRTCACGCRRPAPAPGKGATRPGCRQRRSRANREGAA